MNRLKIKYAVACGFLEIIRCPVIEADTIDIPDWEKSVGYSEF